MHSRGIFSERGAIAAGGIVAPTLVATLQPLPPDWLAYFANLAISLAWAIPLAAATGFGLCWFGFERWQKRQLLWTGAEGAAELMRLSAVELVTGNANPTLLASAQKNAANQEGRVAALYLAERVAQLRRAQPVTDVAVENPVRLLKRIEWTAGLFASSLALALLPAFSRLGLPVSALYVIAFLLVPLWVTAVLTTIAGQPNADHWLNAYKLPKLFKPSAPKLRKPTVTTVAGSWHTRTSATDVPIFRGLLVTILIIAAGLYFLRDYTGDYFRLAEPVPELLPEPSQLEIFATAPIAAPPPRAAPRNPVSAQQAATPSPVEPRLQEPNAWSQLGPRATYLEADREKLRYAGWDYQRIAATLNTAKPRLDSWYFEQLPRNPQLRGRITIGLTLIPSGRIGNAIIVSEDINDAIFVNGLLDRLDALDFGTGAFDPVQVSYSLDFRP